MIEETRVLTHEVDDVSSRAAAGRRPSSVDRPTRRGGFPLYLGYTDPGTGSMLVQVAMAGAAGLAVAAKLGWERTTRRWRKQAAVPTSEGRESTTVARG